MSQSRRLLLGLGTAGATRKELRRLFDGCSDCGGGGGGGGGTTTSSVNATTLSSSSGTTGWSILLAVQLQPELLYWLVPAAPSRPRLRALLPPIASARAHNEPLPVSKQKCRHEKLLHWDWDWDWLSTRRTWEMLGAGSGAAVAARKVWTLRPESELRCEVGENELLTVRVLTGGSCEVFGVELLPNKEYTFTDVNIAVYTWYGCTLETSGDCSALYDSDSTPMVAYVNTHSQLEAMRDMALANGDYGPRVMIVGPSDHGKSTTAKILASYAARVDRCPLFVDLDVGQTLATVPGCITVMPLDKFTISPDESFASTHSAAGLTYFYGYNSPKDNPDLYKTMVTTLGDKIKARMERDADSRSAGIIVNTCGFIDGVGSEIMLHSIRALSIDVVLVMGHDRLYSSLVKELPENTVTVVKLPRSGGVVQRDRLYRARLRRTRIREYFYGIDVYRESIKQSASTFSPARLSLRISSVRIMRAGGLQLSEGMRLIGAVMSESASFQLTSVSPTPDLEGSMLAVLHEDSSSGGGGGGGDGSSLMLSNVAGFVCIVQMDVEQDTMILLAPCPGALPSNVLLVGSMKWDGVGGAARKG